MNECSYNLKFYDFLSLPHNPEELFTLLYIIEKKENYEIYKAINNETREIFAIKIIPLDTKISYRKLRQESLIMKSLQNCDNIIRYYGSYFSFKSKNIWLIFEYFPPGSLYDLLNVIERPLIEQEISMIINDILVALVYMHQLNIIHDHIKLTNILLKENGRSKLGNFSQAKQRLNNSLLISKGKSIDQKYDTKYDIILLGIICIELFKGINNKDFDRNKILDLIKNNNNIKSQRESSKKMIEKYFFEGKDQLCSQEFIDFIQLCLDKNSNTSAYELKNHPFIKNNINSTNTEKLYFLNLIKFNIEKIEYNKKEKNYNKKISTNTKQRNKFHSSINSKKSKKSKNSHITAKGKNSNISNFIENKDENSIFNGDKLAEFQIEQMKKEEYPELDRYTSKDIIVDNSNLDNTGFHYGTDDSFEKSLKSSAFFGKKKNENKTYMKEKNSSNINDIFKNRMNKNIKNNNDENEIKKESNIINNINGTFKEDSLLKKENEEIDYFKENWEHLNKYENIFKTKNTDSNNNYDYNKYFLNLNSDDSIDFNQLNNNFNNDLNNNLYKNSINFNNAPLTEMKCNIIQLGSSIKKIKTIQKSNNTSSYSLKNSIFKVNENDDYSLKNTLNKKFVNNNENIKNSLNKSQRLLPSFKNNFLSDFDSNSKKSFNNKVNKNDISSTCFTSINTPINKIKGFMDIIDEKNYSCKPCISLRQKNIEEICINLTENVKKEKNLLKSPSENNFQQNRKDNLYKYIRELENKEVKNKKNKTNIIKIDKIFNKKKNKVCGKDKKDLVNKGKN